MAKDFNDSVDQLLWRHDIARYERMQELLKNSSNEFSVSYAKKHIAEIEARYPQLKEKNNV